jgi:hypothetical protein
MKVHQILINSDQLNMVMHALDAFNTLAWVVDNIPMDAAMEISASCLGLGQMLGPDGGMMPTCAANTLCDTGIVPEVTLFGAVDFRIVLSELQWRLIVESVPQLDYDAYVLEVCDTDDALRERIDADPGYLAVVRKLYDNIKNIELLEYPEEKDLTNL